jgi:hypothetical protein
MAAIDPNGTVSTPQDRWIWLAPDWSDWTEDSPKAPQSGWTHVKVRETRYNDGRVVTQVLDANTRPVADENGPRPPLASSTDQKQADVYTRQAPKPLPAGGSPTQNRNGRVYGYNPDTGLYDVDQGAVPVTKPTNVYIGTNPTTNKPTQVSEYPDGHKEYDDTQVPASVAASTATTPHVEGTPLPGGSYDNNHPIVVQRDANGQQVGPARELSADERKRWEQETGRSQGTRISEPVKGHPGVFAVKVTDAQGNASMRYEDTQGNVVPEPADAPTYSVQERPINGRVYTTVVASPKDGSPPTITRYGPDGKPVSELPAEIKVGAIVPKGGPKGEDVQAVEDPDHPGQIKYVPITGATPPHSAKMPPGITPPTSFSYGTAAQSLATFWGQLNDAVTKGEITGDEAAALFAPYHQQAQMAATEQNNVLTAQRGIMGDQTTERGQDVNLANTRATVANSIFNNAFNTTATMNQTGKIGSDAGGRAFLASLRLGKGYVGDMGGLVTPGRTPMLPAVQQASQLPLNGVATAPVPTYGQVDAQNAAVQQQSQAAFAGLGITPTAPADLPGVRTGANMTGTGIDGPPTPAPAPVFTPSGPGPESMLPGVESSMNQPMFSPDVTSGMLLNLGFDPDVVAQVHERRTGQPLAGMAA